MTGNRSLPDLSICDATESRRSVKGGKRPSRLSSLSSLLNGKPPIKQCRVRPLQRRILLEIRRVGAAGRQAEWYRRVLLWPLSLGNRRQRLFYYHFRAGRPAHHPRVLIQ